ncbi:hypothetical protein NL676_010551 [Syzygium grande]|nr:hypothetical protein NL676_010551 [Syzygium grande]
MPTWVRLGLHAIDVSSPGVVWPQRRFVRLARVAQPQQPLPRVMPTVEGPYPGSPTVERLDMEISRLCDLGVASPKVTQLQLLVALGHLTSTMSLAGARFLT